MNKTPSEVLAEARDLVVLRGKANEVFYDPETDCYCALGAIYKSAGYVDYGGQDGQLIYIDKSADRLAEAAETYFEVVVGMGTDRYNDHHSKVEVIAKFNEAIALAKSEGK